MKDRFGNDVYVRGETAQDKMARWVSLWTVHCTVEVKFRTALGMEKVVTVVLHKVQLFNSLKEVQSWARAFFASPRYQDRVVW